MQITMCEFFGRLTPCPLPSATAPNPPLDAPLALNQATRAHQLKVIYMSMQRPAASSK